MTPAPRVTVWFDDACPLCTAEVRTLSRLDRRGRVRFVALSGAGDCPLDPAELLARFHARDETNGRMESGAAAFALVWRQIPILAPFGRAAAWPPALAVLERLYKAFLRVRPALQRAWRRAGL